MEICEASLIRINFLLSPVSSLTPSDRSLASVQQYRQGRAGNGGHSGADGAWGRDLSSNFKSRRYGSRSKSFYSLRLAHKPSSFAQVTTFSSLTYSFLFSQVDEDDLKAELDELEQETLDAQLEGAHPVPIHAPGARTAVGKVASAPVKSAEEEEEDKELRELQAALAM